MIGWCHTLTALHRIDPFFFISFIQYKSWVGAIQEPYFFSLSPVTRFMYFILTFLVEGEFPGRHLYKPWNSVSVCSRPSFRLQLKNESYKIFCYYKRQLNLFAHLSENFCQLLVIWQENWIRIKLHSQNGTCPNSNIRLGHRIMLSYHISQMKKTFAKHSYSIFTRNYCWFDMEFEAVRFDRV